MPLHTVRVPATFEALFARAERIVSGYFREAHHDPAHGTIEISGERYVLVRAASLSVEFFALVEELYGRGREAEAEAFTKNILFDLAHAIGRSDAERFAEQMGVGDPLERLSAGPVHFSHTGWAFVDIDPSSSPAPGDDYYLLYDHPYSFESDAWIRAKKPRDKPVCIMNAGYSSGWCEASFDMTLVSVELCCRAAGDPMCRFIMAPPDRIEEHVARFRREGRTAHGQRPSPAPEIPDFFARKRAEEELRRTRDELEQRVDERTREVVRSNELYRREVEERMLVEKKLRQTYKLEAIGRLAGGVAHDFNNLVAVIAMNCDLLRRSLPAGDPLRGYVDDIAEAGARASNLTRQLLAFGRAQPRVGEVLDLNRIVDDMSRMLDRVIGEDVTLVTRLDPSLGHVEQDRGHIEQVLMNLVVNARDAMPKGGSITIETANVELHEARAAELGVLPGRWVTLAVNDTGQGMDEATIARIFDPFFTTKEGGAGTGLGLSTVYGIVQQSGGAITVVSAVGKGSTFTAYLPRVSGVVKASPRVSVRPPPSTSGGHEVILLVEDQARLRAAIAAVLEELGYRVLAAPSPEDAIAIVGAGADPIDMLLTDVVMPKMSGVELAEKIRALRPAMRVLFMSGYAAPVAGHTAAAGPILAKPFEARELAARVREVLDDLGRDEP